MSSILRMGAVSFRAGLSILLLVVGAEFGPISSILLTGGLVFGMGEDALLGFVELPAAFGFRLGRFSSIAKTSRRSSSRTVSKDLRRFAIAVSNSGTTALLKAFVQCGLIKAASWNPTSQA